MTISLKSNPDGVSGAIQVNGIDAVPFTSTGITGERRVKQVVTYQTGAVATGTTIIPLDDTIPQNTEGDQYMSLAITPTNTNSTLEIDIEAHLSPSVSGYVVGALFQDTTASSISASAGINRASAGDIIVINLKHIMTAGTISSTTFKFRAGCTVAATTTFNGISGTRWLGGILSSRMTIKEYLPA